MDFKKIIINKDKTILEALEVLNSIPENYISRLILFVCKSKNEIIGSLTDGDIRRAILSGFSLSIKIEEICNRNFVYENETDGYIGLDKFRKQNLKIIPLLNSKKVLSRVLDLDKTKAIIPIECMIMAGGRGKRLSPLTDSVPKPMLPLNNKPIIHKQMTNKLKTTYDLLLISNDLLMLCSRMKTLLHDSLRFSMGSYSHRLMKHLRKCGECGVSNYYCIRQEDYNMLD